MNVDQIELRDTPRVADPGPFALVAGLRARCAWPWSARRFARPSLGRTGAAACRRAGRQPPVRARGPSARSLRRRRGPHADARARAEETFVVRGGLAPAQPLPQPGARRQPLRRALRRRGRGRALRGAATWIGSRTRHGSGTTPGTTSTLPYWLLDRLHSTVANLATDTCQWWENGRFWAWEGGGCCPGTCGHVWNYEHAMARLFPELERSVREMQDFAPGVGFYPESGRDRLPRRRVDALGRRRPGRLRAQGAAGAPGLGRRRLPATRSGPPCARRRSSSSPRTPTRTA